jgi:SpoVK/Ycf46/Vps4 family AAA+-type ATPase
MDRSGTGLAREHLFEAAREQSESGLGQLAVKMAAPATWDDLVLPPATLSVLEEFSAAAQHREMVYSEWGLGGGHAGLGVKAVFSGASGTGKTMSAVVVARDLGLDLYRIDLSQVVSKYIGETEKNLDRIFNAAARANAVLLFDEADALFGKRSAVRDAHDRYANIEVGYLLQKLEDYAGVAILATNLSGNMDEAFARRLQYAVEFPLPDESLRLALWRKAFPSTVPVDPAVDFAVIARQYKLTGGEIRSVSLTAAFLAAAEGGSVSANVLSKALNRHLIRSGRIPAQTSVRPERTPEGRRGT